MGECEPLELGRLQSNFIGTEFQIFSPSIDHSSSNGDSIGDAEIDSDIEIGSNSLKVFRKDRKLSPPVKGENSDEDQSNPNKNKMLKKNSKPISFRRLLWRR